MDRASTRPSSSYAYSGYRQYDPFSWIFMSTVALLSILGLVAYAARSVFFIDSIISIAVISVVYYYRKRLLFSWEGTLLCCLGWLMKMLGTLGAYDLYIAGIGWDKALHFISILGVTLLVHAYLSRKGLNMAETAILTFLIAQGFGAVNEIAEFIGTHYFGAGQGLFGMMNGLSEPANKFYMYDTHYDLIANTLAILLGLWYGMRKQVYNKRASTST